MRACVFLLLLLNVAVPQLLLAQAATPPGNPNSPAARSQASFDPPKLQTPDDRTLTQIAEKTAELRQALKALKERKIPDEVLIEVEIYLKAAENIVRLSEWYAAASGKWAITTLDQGLARAKDAESGSATWRDQSGKWVVRAYRSSLDGSIQPYALLTPSDYRERQDWRMDVVLHGRDSSLTEAKFIATHQGDAPKDLDHVQVEVYGRGNNAYRWAGEADVFEVIEHAAVSINRDRVVLRGFSMGGAGTWHIGLHHPDRFCVLGPGAGFTTTHGYVPGLPHELPEYAEKCLHIYDAVDYAENAYNVPVVAYSGEKDPQRQAATNIENALANFPEPLRFTHLIAPGLEHQMPKEWQAKADTEYRRYADKGRSVPERVRFVTYTPRYGRCDWVQIDALRRTYERAEVDGTRKENSFDVTTKNVRRITLLLESQKPLQAVKIDGQQIDIKQLSADQTSYLTLEWATDKWELLKDLQSIHARLRTQPEKRARLQGPIDDAFTAKFVVIKPRGTTFSSETANSISAVVSQFESIWDRYFRGTLPQATATVGGALKGQNLILFGDPQSNPIIAELLPKLPIRWTETTLTINGIDYDARTHFPVMIYPNPRDPDHYVVLNSGHTFSEADLKRTNALLYPHLGDWAVIKSAPTAEDPSAHEVISAGLFDEKWQFGDEQKGPEPKR